MKASARPCTPIPIGLWRLLDLSACKAGQRDRLFRLSTHHSAAGSIQKGAYLRHWVVVDVNDLVQVFNDDFGDGGKPFEVKGFLWGDAHVECNGSQVTHGNLKKEQRFFMENFENNFAAQKKFTEGSKLDWYICRPIKIGRHNPFTYHCLRLCLSIWSILQ